jgi:MYXO-CTERM domain-containing protein
LLRREVPSSPGAAFAKLHLYVDGAAQPEYHGVYLLIEDIDRQAVRRRWGIDLGRLVKYSKAGCPSELQYDDGPPNASRAAFDAWIARSPTSVEEAAKGVDLDTVLRQEAIREILVNGDDTLFFAGGDGNNHYYFDPQQGGLRQYMPWDVDLTFGQQQQNCAPNSLKCPPTFPLLTWCSRNVSRLGRALACNPMIQKRYLQTMCQLTQGSLSAAEILKVWNEADAAARPAVALEKDAVWGGKDPLDPAIDKSYGAEHVRMKDWIPARIRSVQQQLTMRGVACAPGCPAGATEACSYLGCPGDRRCENDLWTPCRPREGCGLPLPQLATTAPATDGGARDTGPAATDAGTGTGGRGDAGTGGATPPGPGLDGAVAGTGGAGGAAGATGGGPAPRPRTGGAPGEPTDPGPAPDPAGCACSLDGRAPTAGGALPLGLVLAAVVTRRRRRRLG